LPRSDVWCGRTLASNALGVNVSIASTTEGNSMVLVEPWLLTAVLAAFGLAVGVVIGVLAFVLWGHTRFARYYAHHGKPPPSSSFRITRIWLNEIAAILMLGLWFLRGWRQDGFVRAMSAHRGRPVVCVHGMGTNGTNMWGIRRALENAGRPTYAIDLGRPLQNLDRFIPALGRALREAMERHPEAEGVDVVAHSMGGIVLRMCLAADPMLAQRIHAIVTLGSPHQGTAGARGIPYVPEALALGRKSSLLKTLPSLRALCPQARLTTIASSHDYVVYPRETSHIEGGASVDLDGIGHTGLLVNKAAIARVLEAVADAPPT
jgi:pimeloyl-ACP methyl ester carboxylesterase